MLITWFPILALPVFATQGQVNSEETNSATINHSSPIETSDNSAQFEDQSILNCDEPMPGIEHYFRNQNSLDGTLPHPIEDFPNDPRTQGDLMYGWTEGQHWREKRGAAIQDDDFRDLLEQIESKRAKPGFNSWGGKRASPSFHSWGGKRSDDSQDLGVNVDSSSKIKRDDLLKYLQFANAQSTSNGGFKRRPAFNSWGGKRSPVRPAFNSWGGKRSSSGPAFNSWGGKRDPAFNSWGEKRGTSTGPAFNSWGGKRGPAFNSWGGKRSPAFNSWGGKRDTAFNSWGGKRDTAFNSWGGKRDTAFNSWGGKRDTAFNSWGGKRDTAFNSWGGKRDTAFNSWGGKRSPAFNSWGGKRGPAFNSWGGKRGPAFYSWGGKRSAGGLIDDTDQTIEERENGFENPLKFNDGQELTTNLSSDTEPIILQKRDSTAQIQGDRKLNSGENDHSQAGAMSRPQIYGKEGKHNLSKREIKENASKERIDNAPSEFERILPSLKNNAQLQELVRDYNEREKKCSELKSRLSHERIRYLLNFILRLSEKEPEETKKSIFNKMLLRASSSGYQPYESTFSQARRGAEFHSWGGKRDGLSGMKNYE